jgi:hypothetical protein
MTNAPDQVTPSLLTKGSALNRARLYGAQRAQPVATGDKWGDPKKRSNKPIRNRWQLTATVSKRMVRRGSTVRVRQRASRKSLQIVRIVCPDRKRPSRAGTCGHYLTFPR